KKPVWREWFDAAIFAVVAATLIRTFIFEAYVIPSGSMENTLLVKDFLFVSKLSYGPRIPNTPLSVPFVHNYLPVTNGKSYSTAIQLPYTRWFASLPKRGDVVVFNFPEGDTVIHRPEFESAVPYYQVMRELGNGNEDLGRKQILSDPDRFPLAIHPVDKSDNYIKRCVAVSGDVLQIVNGEVVINGNKEVPPPHSKRPYLVKLNGQVLDAEIMKKEYDLDLSSGQDYVIFSNDSVMLNLSSNAAQTFAKAAMVKSIRPMIDRNYEGYAVAPFVVKNRWTIDNYGPIWIPQKHKSITLNDSTYAIYQRPIRVYEGNELTAKDGKFYVNGKEANSYTFKMDYFWMMGDNRHGSQDSRFWGFVPEDRIVGKAWMIWFSWENGPRWRRLFNIVK
ncbi:MAG: S26 family signal peptidase, partial [Chitinophagaceae bacterium]